MATPYTSAYKKYEVGEEVTTVINLLDFEGGSPLLTSTGWISTEGNGINELANAEIPGLSINGLPLTEDFDLAVYVKGDRKSTVVYYADLVIDYESDDETPPPSDDEFDIIMDDFKTFDWRVVGGTTGDLRTYITNDGPDAASGTIEFTVVTKDYGMEPEEIDRFEVPIGEVAAGESVLIYTPWTAPFYEYQKVVWTATIIADGDTDMTNNSISRLMLLVSE